MIFRNLTRFIFLVASAVTVLSLGLHTPVATARPGQSSDVPAIAEFDDLWDEDQNRFTDAIRSDIGEQYVHKALATNGGWADFPGTGNFTLKTAGDSKKAKDNGRKMTLDFFLYPQAELPDLPQGCDVQPNIQEAAYFGYPNLVTPAFMSINRIEENTGGLEALTVNDGAVPAWVGGNFEDPQDSRAIYVLRCGQTIGEKNACGTDFVNVVCENETSGKCVQWRIEPSGGRDQLRCRLWRDKQANSALIGDFNLPFGLTIFRDADSDGFPD